MPTPEELREHYAQLSDDRIEYLALHEAADLTPEALDVLRAEIHNRQISPENRKAVDLQLNALGKREFPGLTQWFRTTPCPICGKSNTPLNAYLIGEVVTVFVVIKHSTSLVLGCAQCIRKAAREAQKVTAVAGWWGLRGIIYTMEAIDLNSEAMKAEDYDPPTEEFIDFVRQNVRVIAEKREQSSCAR